MRASTVEKAHPVPWLNCRQNRCAISYALFLFASGSIGGWCLELVFRSLTCGELQLPGFLYGSYCPIYGVGVLLITLLCRETHPVRACFRIAIAASLLEYLTSWFFETYFRRLLWDYSALPLSIGTRVSLPFSLAWGVLGGAFRSLLEPRLRRAYQQHTEPLNHLSRMVIVLMTFDTICSMAATVSR